MNPELVRIVMEVVGLILLLFSIYVMLIPALLRGLYRLVYRLVCRHRMMLQLIHRRPYETVLEGRCVKCGRRAEYGFNPEILDRLAKDWLYTFDQDYRDDKTHLYHEVIQHIISESRAIPVREGWTSTSIKTVMRQLGLRLYVKDREFTARTPLQLRLEGNKLYLLCSPHVKNLIKSGEVVDLRVAGVVRSGRRITTCLLQLVGRLGDHIYILDNVIVGRGQKTAWIARPPLEVWSKPLEEQLRYVSDRSNYIKP